MKKPTGSVPKPFVNPGESKFPPMHSLTKRMIMTFAPRFISLSFVVAAAISAPLFSTPANAAEPPKEQDLIGVLQSDSPPQDKAITCKKLAVYGSKEAVPALAALLTNPELSSWARIALEAIPGPESDEALRSALSK